MAFCSNDAKDSSSTEFSMKLNAFHVVVMSIRRFHDDRPISLLDIPVRQHRDNIGEI